MALTAGLRTSAAAARAWLPRDARVLQIAFLVALLMTGVLLRDFSIHPLQVALAFAAGFAAQAFWLKRLGLRQRGFLSAIVTCCGLSLLLRADSLWVHPLAAAVAMSSKFVLRLNGKHLYNPANLGVIAAITLLPGTWVSPGQWGSDLALAVWFLTLGTLVTERARRLDVSWVFLGAFLGLVGLRVLLLGQPWTIWWHQFGNGALLLFAFFMISDPMTIPNGRAPRIAYAIVVACGAAAWQYLVFRPNALIWALFLATPLVPLLDRWFPAQGFEWRPAIKPAGSSPG
ncbi:MAG TPA: RnfABCDGE type electron transport complex subunit D [Casimicrobiaceae bacterium]|nr:RnfABCDGE type electron transport complex subunit D [Casimicrobiaceae bacterium]